MSGMWCKEHIVKPSYQRDLAVQDFVPEQTEHLVVKLAFLKSIEMIKTRLCSPAQKDRRGHVVRSPVHDLLEFVPVVYFFKFHLLDRSSCNDHSVKTSVFEIRKSLIEFIQMTDRSVSCLMALHCHKSHIHLQRCVGERTQKLKLCLLLEWHQVQDQDLDRTNVLMHSPSLVHNEYIFSFQNFFYR